MLEKQIYSKPAARSKTLFSKLDSIARKTGLIVRESPRFNAGAFLLTLMKATITGRASFGEMASTLKKCELKPMSRQALWMRVGTRSVAFIIETLAVAMEEKWGLRKIVGSKDFKRVLIEDSSQAKLHKSNSKNFPGHGNAKSESSGCKIDLSFDLLSGEPVHQILHAATMQDKVLGRELVDMVRPGDLVLRDMGYFSIKEFRMIAERRAFWVSRLPANVGVYMEDGQELEKYLRSFKGNTLDVMVSLGKKAGEKVRLVAMRATKNITEQRRRNRRKVAAQKGKKPPANTLLRDGWHLMVTNVGKEQLGTQKLTELYAVRWQIEITFRAWKQSGELLKALDRKSNVEHLQTLIYANILWLILTMKTASILQQTIAKSKQVVSLEKLAKDMSEHLLTISNINCLPEYEPYIRHVIMESRRREPLMATGLRCLS